MPARRRQPGTVRNERQLCDMAEMVYEQLGTHERGVQTAQKAERMNTGTIKHGTRTGSGRSMERKAGGPEMTTLLIWGCTFLVVAACALAAGLMHEAGKNSREEEDEH